MMANRIEKKLLKTPVSVRRGVATTWDANDWESVLVHLPFETMMDRLAGGDGIGGVVTDQTQAILAGTLSAPDGAWYLVVELLGTPWLQIAHGNKTFAHHDQLVTLAQARVLTTGHQDTASATYLTLTDAGKQTLQFESTGMQALAEDDDEFDEDFEDEFEVPLRFETDFFPADWPNQFKSEDLVQQALMRELEAYAPILGVGTEQGRITLWAWHEDVLDPKYIKRIGLVLVGEQRTAEPNPASQQLKDAIMACDPDTVARALSNGASLKQLPGTANSALGQAMESYKMEPAGLHAIVQLLLEAGADPDDGGASRRAPLFSAIDKFQNHPQLGVDLCTQLLDAGASISAQVQDSDASQSPLHHAACAGHLTIVQMLHGRGVDLSLSNSKGQSAREAVADLIQTNLDYFGEDAEVYIAGQRQVLAYLDAAEAGALPSDDWREQLAQDQKQATRKSREMKVQFGKLGKAFEQLGEQFEQPEGTDQGDGDATVQDLVDLVGTAQAKRLLEQMQGGIDLTPGDNAWVNTKQRDREAGTFEGLGFETIGYFVAGTAAPTRVMAFVHEAQGWYGVIYDPPGQRQFCDVVRLHADDSVLTVTSNDQPAAYELDRFRKVRLPREGVAKLVEAMRREAIPACGLKPVSAEAFVHYVKWVTAQEQAELLRSLD